MAQQAHKVRVEMSPKRVRALVGGIPVFDTTAARLVWEKPYYPTYYIPRADMSAELRENGETIVRDGLGKGRALDLHVGDQAVADAALAYDDGTVPELRGLLRLRWSAMDEWLEEDEPVYVHPRDPYKRVDILPSSRHVRVALDGVTVAESRKPTLLFETGLPTRYYLPVGDVCTDLLRPTGSVTRCPYKGTASWWSLDVGGTVHDDLVWMYRTPIAESQRIAGLMAFYNERVDLYVDGELQERPDSPFA
jgi:uncharacterized protein (DUF427 family)